MNKLFYVVPAMGIIGLLFTAVRSAWVSKQDAGNERMTEIAKYIAEGAMAFLKAEYKILSYFVVIAGLLLGFMGYSNPKSSPFIAVAFVIGAVFSALAGFIGMRIATKANVRTAQAARLAFPLSLSDLAARVKALCHTLPCRIRTEVIADGKHLDAGLLQLALKLKGPDRLALVTDCSRALDMPSDRTYLIGPSDGGEPLIKRDGVGMIPDLSALASSVEGMDHMVRTFTKLTGRPLWEAIRMASLTPARIAGHDRDLGSLERGKRADVLVFDRDLAVRRVFIDGIELRRLRK